MFREMRRKKQQLSEEETLKILKNGTAGVLALAGDDDYPYALPISYVYDNGKLFFHSAKTGHKIDAIQNSDKASFCVIQQDEVIPEEYTTYFRSVIAFGKIRILEDEGEFMDAINKLAIRYFPEDTEEHRMHNILKAKELFHMIELDIEHITGKEAKELAKKKPDHLTK